MEDHRALLRRLEADPDDDAIRRRYNVAMARIGRDPRIEFIRSAKPVIGVGCYLIPDDGGDVVAVCDSTLILGLKRVFSKIFSKRLGLFELSHEMVLNPWQDQDAFNYFLSPPTFRRWVQSDAE